MGVNLVLEVDGFFIENKQFRQAYGDRSVDLGCISEGKRRILRFNLCCHNKGDKDLVVGNPKERTDVLGLLRYILGDSLRINFSGITYNNTLVKCNKRMVCLTFYNLWHL
jgi:hypothetical protein